jgi:type I restriction enzyme M protein
MFLHNISYDKFHIETGDTLTDPRLAEHAPFDAVIANPPYSITWVGSDDEALMKDERFSPAGVLAPKSKADFAFVMHALSYLSDKGRAALVSFPGIFYRGGAEQKIRKYLIDNNYVEAIIALPAKMFISTTIAVNILVLSKHKSDKKTQFIDASTESFYTVSASGNEMGDEHIAAIMQMFESRDDVSHVAKTIENSTIADNDYNLSVSLYVEAKDTREKIDITKVNEEIKIAVAKIDTLREEIDKIVEEIEGDEK